MNEKTLQAKIKEDLDRQLQKYSNKPVTPSLLEEIEKSVAEYVSDVIDTGNCKIKLDPNLTQDEMIAGKLKFIIS